MDSTELMGAVELMSDGKLFDFLTTSVTDARTVTAELMARGYVVTFYGEPPDHNPQGKLAVSIHYPEPEE